MKWEKCGDFVPWVCARCGAVVEESEKATHDAWHLRQRSMWRDIYRMIRNVAGVMQ